MTIVLITGMSAVGKSTVLAELGARGHNVLDTDEGGFAEEIDRGHGQEQVWIPDRIEAALSEFAGSVLFVAGTVSNQGMFYPRFDVIALLSAPLEVMLERVIRRTNNRFGKTAAERKRIVRDTDEVLPLLRRTATVEIDTVRPVTEVADALEQAAGLR